MLLYALDCITAPSITARTNRESARKSRPRGSRFPAASRHFLTELDHDSKFAAIFLCASTISGEISIASRPTGELKLNFDPTIASRYFPNNLKIRSIGSFSFSHTGASKTETKFSVSRSKTPSSSSSFERKWWYMAPVLTPARTNTSCIRVCAYPFSQNNCVAAIKSSLREDFERFRVFFVSWLTGVVSTAFFTSVFSIVAGGRRCGFVFTAVIHHESITSGEVAEKYREQKSPRSPRKRGRTWGTPRDHCRLPGCEI